MTSLPSLLRLSLTLVVLTALYVRAATFDDAKLAAVPKAMQRFVEDKTIAGAVTLVATSDRIVFTNAVGFADLEKKVPMKEDNFFWIASMTKPMTAVCVMMLQDDGKLSVDDPVEKWLPEFKGQWLVEEKSTDRLVLKRPARVITLRDLLTHTSGLGDVTAPRFDCSLAELAMAYAREPLLFEPGSKWSYCNSGINTLGRIVEVVSGQPYAAFLEARVFRPLGMRDTTFWPTLQQVKRIAKPYEPAEKGGLRETNVFIAQGRVSDLRRTPLPAGGLYSTAQDVAKFYQMMLQRGAWNGKRLLSDAAVDQLTRTQTGELKTGFVDGMSFGFGFQVVKEPQGVVGMFSRGTFGHGGAYGTQSWADPKTGVIYILMIQRAKLGNGDAAPIRQAFQEAAAAAVKE
jgi:CubicO group peptidase (beta-lactamase class C family)